MMYFLRWSIIFFQLNLNILERKANIKVFLVKISSTEDNIKFLGIINNILTNSGAVENFIDFFLVTGIALPAIKTIKITKNLSKHDY